MKQSKRVERLERRRQEYEQMMKRMKFTTEAYRRPGSFNK